MYSDTNTRKLQKHLEDYRPITAARPVVQQERSAPLPPHQYGMGLG